MGHASDGSKPSICLNMIVKNEAHIIHEALEAVAPYIDCWVIVDTGSEDGTQDVIRKMMAELNIPGEIHERPWRDFGQNRSEALVLAQGHADYIWVMDADDTVEGAIDFTGLTADAYKMRISLQSDAIVWRLQLFRDGVPWRYTRALHELAVCDEPVTVDRLDGEYHILGRHLGGRSIDRVKTLEQDRDLLLAEVERDPDDRVSMFYLGKVNEGLHDYAAALTWYTRRAEVGDHGEAAYTSLFKVAEMMARLDEPWDAIKDAYLRAWENRPTRAEPLHAVASHYRQVGRYELGYLYAARAAQIPFPESDTWFVNQGVYRWRALDEQAVCASWIGRSAEALKLFRHLLTLDELPDEQRQRIIGNRDGLAAHLVQASTAYPAHLTGLPAGRDDAEVTVTVTATRDAAGIERTINSFMTCCTDSDRVGRFVVIDTGLSHADRASLAQHYPFLDFVTAGNADLDVIRNQIGGRYWLHLWTGWRFFTDEGLVGRLVDVLESEPEVFQVGLNLSDARALGPDSPALSGVRLTGRGNRYLLSATAAVGPAMFDMERLNHALENAARTGQLGGQTATLDEVLCVHDS